MAPEKASLPKRKPRENQYLFDLGVRGRKTGLTLPDTGIRDENGLEPMDHLFSSPEKPKSQGRKRGSLARSNPNGTISSEEDMDVGESTIPEPAAVLSARKRAGLRIPPPRSKSPIKTFLQSPARRNPSMGLNSSPIRGSIVSPRPASVSTTVRRKLQFSKTDVSVDGSPQKRAGSAMPAIGTSVPDIRGSKSLQPAFLSENSMENEDDYQPIDGDEGDEGDEVDEGGVQSDEPEESPEPEPEPEPAPPIRNGKGKSKARRSRNEVEPLVTEEEMEEETEGEAEEEAAEESDHFPEAPQITKPKRGRPKRPPPIEEEKEEEEDAQPPTKRSRKSPEAAEVVGRGRKPRNAPAAIEQSKAKGPGRKPKLTTISEADSPQVKRGPPMPRNNRGLYILRRETPMEGSGFQQTRSGRNSIKPLAFWKNEKVEYSDDEAEDQHGKFLLSRIKKVVRAEEVDNPKRPRNKSKASKSKKQKQRAESESEEDVDGGEPWESEPGRVWGEIRNWDPADKTGLLAEEVEEEIALSSAAIITRDIPGSSVRFAKILTRSFFGSGVVDLPPGSIKKMKNSRKMQMIFFVFYGRVQVKVNENEFRIGKGGMWQVPRGNFYSIENDYDKPARIFFAQGCEIEEEVSEA